MSVCVVCKRVVDFGDRGDPSLEGTCGAECLRRLQQSVAVTHHELARVRQLEAEDAQAEWARRTGRGGAPLAIPVNTAPVAPLSAARAEEMREFVTRLVTEAFRTELPAVEPATEVDASESAAPPPFTPSPEWTRELCRACRGRCCRDGYASGAFLTVGMFRRLRQTYPELGPDALVAVYTSRLPAEALEGGCAFQARDGCTLPREFRATICNDFYCPSFKRALGVLAASGASEAIASGFEHVDGFPSRVVRVGEGVFEVLSEIPSV